MPSDRSAARVGSTALVSTASTMSAPATGTGEYAPMPPVLGPVSPSPTRLKSWAGASGTARSPSHTHSTESSGPDSPSSMTTPPRSSFERTSAAASSNDSVTSTPFPPARPSVLTT